LWLLVTPNVVLGVLKEINFNLLNMDEKTREFLTQSNWIEREYSERAERDAVKAWEWIYKKKAEPLKISMILKVHNYLAKNISPDIAGKLRDCDVYIGGQKKMFVNEYILKKQLNNFCVDFNKFSTTANVSEEVIKQNHVLFEDIHPFVDFNGRAGRILYNLLRLKVGMSIHVIHGIGPEDSELPEDQINYYKWFK